MVVAAAILLMDPVAILSRSLHNSLPLRVGARRQIGGGESVVVKFWYYHGSDPRRDGAATSRNRNLHFIAGWQWPHGHFVPLPAAVAIVMATAAVPHMLDKGRQCRETQSICQDWLKVGS